MVDLAQLFDKSVPKPKRDKFLARLLGLFSEEIVKIWAEENSCLYKNLGRPTITRVDTNKRYTLDFTLSLKSPEQPETHFVTEMKCWTEYENYKFLNLAATGQLEKLNSYPAFKLFLEMAKQREGLIVKVHQQEVQYDGLILIWSRAEPEVIEKVKRIYGLYEVLTLENIINDLIRWNSHKYKVFLNERADWCSHLFNTFADKN